jgi:hypothetical protein
MYIISLVENISLPISAGEKVINIIYGEDSNYVEDWINTYCMNEIESLIMCPLLPNVFSINYTMEKDKQLFKLIKNYKKLKEGYIFNSYKNVSEIVFSIKYTYFNENENENENILNKLAKLNRQDKQDNGTFFVQKETCHRIMENLNKEELLQIIINFESALITKNIWNNKELELLQNETIKNYRKTMYNNISRKVKKINKKIENNKIQKDFNVILPKTCKIEWEII